MVCLSKYLSSELPEILLTNSQSDAYSRHTMFQVASRKRSDQRKAQPGSGVNNSSDEKNNRLTRDILLIRQRRNAGQLFAFKILKARSASG